MEIYDELFSILKDNNWNGSWYELEKICAVQQGKGWAGDGSIDVEISSCLNFFKNSPKTIIDIGSNKGVYTETLLEKNPNSFYYLFEPSRTNLDILEKKFKSYDNVSIIPCALSHTSNSSLLYSNEPGSGLASLTQRKLDHFGISMNYVEEIKTIRFDEYWKSLDDKSSHIDYVKMDVEGHEMDVLEGFGNLIEKVKLIQFEFGGCNIDTKIFFQDFWYYFKDKNFDIYRITPNGPSYIPSYTEYDEFFSTTNYIAVNNDLRKYNAIQMF